MAHGTQHTTALRRRNDAEEVSIMVDRAIQVGTADAKQAAEEAAREFFETHGMTWQQACPKRGKHL